MLDNNWLNVNIKADESCPIATRDIAVNLKNRQNAIDTAGYGPLNPKKPNSEFWAAKAERWDVSPEEAQQQKCGNCAAFIKTDRMLKCIDEGLGNESGNAAWDVIEAGDLGYCEAFDFKCASARTCDAWIVGGPITKEKENNMEEKSLEEMFNELLQIEEKVAPIVPVMPMPRPSGLNPSGKNRGQRPQRPGFGPVGHMRFGSGKASDEDMYEEDDSDMMYDDMYEGDNDEDKRIGGNPGSPRDAADRQRGREFLNWASGQAPGGGSSFPSSTGPLDIGKQGSRKLGQQRMTDVMRMRGWTNPQPRPSVRPERGPGWDGRPARPTRGPGRPAPRPRTVNPPNPPIPQGRNKPKQQRDWGSDNAAQQISGGIPIKSAWDQEAYEEYGFEVKKLPMGGGGRQIQRPKNNRSADASFGAMSASNARGLRAAGEYFSGRSGSNASADAMEGRGKQRVRRFGSTAIGAAGPMSSAPVGDKRPVTRQNPGVDRVRASEPSSLINFRGNRPYSGSPGGNAPRQRTNPGAIRSLAGFGSKAEDDFLYEEDNYFIDEKSGVAYSSNRRNDLRYGPWQEVGNPGAGVMGRRATSAISSDAMPGMRFRKGTDAEMYIDDEDEVAIPPDIDGGKALTQEQAEGLRQTGNFFSGRNTSGSSYGSADTMAARGANRRSKLFENFGSEGPKRPGKYSAPKPRTPNASVTKRPAGMTGSADSMERRIGNRPRPNTGFSSTPNRNRPSGSPGGNAPRRPSANPANPPKRKPSNSLLGSLQNNYDEQQTGPKLFGRHLW